MRHERILWQSLCQAEWQLPRILLQMPVETEAWEASLSGWLVTLWIMILGCVSLDFCPRCQRL